MLTPNFCYYTTGLYFYLSLKYLKIVLNYITIKDKYIIFFKIIIQYLYKYHLKLNNKFVINLEFTNNRFALMILFV